ncbi:MULTISPECIES: hypothetical protein [Okeania]|uniref:hypothetical protein n=1 Tax=Okeania TaxID=1458928 RepID=UPI0013B8A22F|nr:MULTISPECIES: hypothetical protein [Okeania]NES77854.1 hypothetical protein [Okeania sp. SIO1H4]NET20070.1 hypothetical protein [Okeania sp. SIO1H5]NET76717.1 hypothetical protein [Okeania sp. SIO1F9]NET92079.1 hypothetical protein [Okeania sp. SIO1H2]
MTIYFTIAITLLSILSQEEGIASTGHLFLPSCTRWRDANVSLLSTALYVYWIN